MILWEKRYLIILAFFFLIPIQKVSAATVTIAPTIDGQPIYAVVSFDPTSDGTSFFNVNGGSALLYWAIDGGAIPDNSRYIYSGVSPGGTFTLIVPIGVLPVGNHVLKLGLFMSRVDYNGGTSIVYNTYSPVPFKVYSLNVPTCAATHYNCISGLPAFGYSTIPGISYSWQCVDYNSYISSVTCGETIVCSPFQGLTCASPPNSCGATNAGVILCDGTCSAAASVPSNPPLLNTSCSGSSNSCGDTNANNGIYVCSGQYDVICSANAPADRYGYGAPCTATSQANACNQTTSLGTGSINCNGVCVKNPIVGSFNGIYPAAVAVSGNYAYVAEGGNNSFEVIDISNPTNPVRKGFLADGVSGATKQPSAVYISGNYAYLVSQGTNDLEIIDISNPANPVLKGSLAYPTRNYWAFLPTSVFVVGNYAYIGSLGYQSLEVADVSDPTHPMSKGSLVNGAGGAQLNDPTSVYVAGNYAYVADYGSSVLEIIDISNPANPVHAGAYFYSAPDRYGLRPYSVFVVGNYAYLATYGMNYLEIVDVSNPANPVRKSFLTDGVGNKQASSIFVLGNYAYLTWNGPYPYDSSALKIIDISNPANPVVKSSVVNGVGGAAIKQPKSVYVSGNYAYIASYGTYNLLVVEGPNVPPVRAPDVTTPNGVPYQGSCILASAPNGCGMTTTASGTYNCFGICSAIAPAAPSISLCTAPPAPVISGPFTNGQYSATANPTYAYSQNGYQIFAKATSPYVGTPYNSNLTYYFEYSTDGVTWARGGWAGGVMRP